MPSGRCKFCGMVRRFARAHIIPKSFYGINASQGANFIYSGKQSNKPKKSPSGIYDEELLCLECESKFSYLDTYAGQKLKPWPRRSQLIKDDNGFIMKPPGESKGGYWLKDIKIDRLKLFFCFLTWRCARTIREELSVKLSEDIVLKLESSLKSLNADSANIHVLGSRFSDRRSVPLFSPWPRSPKPEQPINFVMFGLHFLVQFQAPDELPELYLGYGPQWPIIFDEFKGSKLHQIAMRMVTAHPSPWMGLRARGRVA
jgi:hypothetical protein